MHDPYDPSLFKTETPVGLCPRCASTAFRRDDGAKWCYVCDDVFFPNFISFLKNTYGVELCEPLDDLPFLE